MIVARMALASFLFIGGCALLPSNQSTVVGEAAPIIEEGDYAEHRAEITVAGAPSIVRAYFDEGAWKDALVNDDKIAFPTSSEGVIGNWPEVNASRRVALSDGEFVNENILSSTYPTRLEYQAWNFTGSAGSNINYVISDFEFLETDDGQTRVVWTHKMRAKSSFVQKFLGGFVKRKFAPFMEQTLQDFAQSVEADIASKAGD